jgi:hypothetical protein
MLGQIASGTVNNPLTRGLSSASNVVARKSIDAALNVAKTLVK